LFSSEDQKEGMQAFIENAPRWRAARKEPCHVRAEPATLRGCSGAEAPDIRLCTPRQNLATFRRSGYACARWSRQPRA
jgi:hypothetical protein